MSVERTLSIIKPDAVAKNVIGEIYSRFEKAGLKDIWGEGDCSSAQSNRAWRVGHGIGMATTEPPHIALFDDTELKAGMVVTVEPGIYLPGWGGVRIEDLVQVTTDGINILSACPKTPNIAV